MGSNETSSAGAPAPLMTSLSRRFRSAASASSSSSNCSGSAAESWKEKPVAAWVNRCTPVSCLTQRKPVNASSSSLPHRPLLLARALLRALCRRRRLLLHPQHLPLMRQERFLQLRVLALELVDPRARRLRARRFLLTTRRLPRK